MDDCHAAPDAGWTPPHLDHVFSILAPQTLSEINACAFLAEERFGRLHRPQMESSLAGRYTATRIIGENTFVELFDAPFGGDEFADVTVGLVLSFNKSGDYVEARRRLEERGIGFRGELIKRKVAGEEEQVPWYQSTRPDQMPGSPLTLFASEVVPEYLERIGVKLGAGGQLDRAAYLEAILRRPHGPQQTMRDITGLTLRLRPSRVKRLGDALEAFGYVRTGSAALTRLNGPEVQIDLIADETSTEGLLEIRIEMGARGVSRRFDFGPHSSLILSPDGPLDTRAVWRFEP